MFTYYTIIGRDLKLLKGHVENIKHYAGFDSIPGEKEFLAIVYKNDSIPTEVTENILSYCEKKNVRTVLYVENKPTFIENLYECWNLGYEHSKDGLVFRGGSDQFFSQNSFVNIYNAALQSNVGKEKVVLQAQTIESMRATVSRHIKRDFGLTFETFREPEFKSLCEQLIKQGQKQLLKVTEAVNIWGHPTPFSSSLGTINRSDGCSWLVHKKDWEAHGPHPVFEGNHTGDVILLDRFTKAGYKDYIVNDCITYHFVRGESNHFYE